MKKILFLLLILIVLAAAICAWIFLGPATGFSAKKEYLYIRTNAATKEAVLDSLQKNKIVKNRKAFNWLANRMNYWSNIKPGRYEIEKGSSIIGIVRKIRNGQQEPVNFVINKIRTKEDFARMVGRKFETDSTQMIQFLNSNDSLQSFGVNTENAVTLILPDTYTFLWNSSPKKIYQKFADEAEKFWTAERKQKAQNLGLTPQQVYTVASIVDEETNAKKEKGNVASVYLNRIKIGMPLQADPTVKFALKDFGLKRIYQKHLAVESPYNTYKNRGLPPGPISTPIKATIDAVLNAPDTEYIYFVASPAFDGTHIFTTNYAEHLKKAKEYQKALDSLEKARQAKAQNK